MYQIEERVGERGNCANLAVPPSADSSFLEAQEIRVVSFDEPDIDKAE